MKYLHINWTFLYNKRFLLTQKQKQKQKYALLNLKIRKRLLNYFLINSSWSFSFFLKKFYYLNYFKKKKNLHLNVSDFKGNIINKYSGGMFHKGRLKISYYAISDLFLNQKLVDLLRSFYKKKYKPYIIINIRAKKKDRKIKKNLKWFILKNRWKIKFWSIRWAIPIAHNGVRKKKLPRK